MHGVKRRGLAMGASAIAPVPDLLSRRATNQLEPYALNRHR